MVDPDLTGAEDGDPLADGSTTPPDVRRGRSTSDGRRRWRSVAVGSTPPPDVRRGDPYVVVPRRFAVVHVDDVDDDVGDVLQCDAPVAHDFLRYCNLKFFKVN
jgi:hypothetical protein